MFLLPQHYLKWPTIDLHFFSTFLKSLLAWMASVTRKFKVWTVQGWCLFFRCSVMAFLMFAPLSLIIVIFYCLFRILQEYFLNYWLCLHLSVSVIAQFANTGLYILSFKNKMTCYCQEWSVSIWSPDICCCKDILDIFV